MESIKIGNKTYLLVADGYQLRDEGGKIIFQPGTEKFEDVETALAAADSIQLLDDTGTVIASRTDLVYAGRLSRDASYVIGADDNAEDVTGAVMIAEFRVPDLREELDTVRAQVDYIAMMTDTQMEV